MARMTYFLNKINVFNEFYIPVRFSSSLRKLTEMYFYTLAVSWLALVNASSDVGDPEQPPKGMLLCDNLRRLNFGTPVAVRLLESGILQ